MPNHDIQFRSDMTVELVRAAAQDSDVLFAARVSTQGEQSLADIDTDATRSKGLVNYLMRDRHGCFDAATDVLTYDGWKAWETVDGTERFLTLSPGGRIEYQRATRVVNEVYRGPMVRLESDQIDLLVTPDHRVLVQPDAGGQSFALVAALDLIQRQRRVVTAGGAWRPGRAEATRPACHFLLGAFIGCGFVVDDDLRFPTAINDAVKAAARSAGFDLVPAGESLLLTPDEEFLRHIKLGRDVYGAFCLPQELMHGDREELEQLLSGVMHAGGGSADDRREHCTPSGALAGQLQELGIKTGRTIRVTTCEPHESQPRRHIKVSMLSGGQPCGEVAAHETGLRIETYDGSVHCVSVPNGTLYVRRSGKAAWSGNSPFEHNSMTFYVQAPIFVFREFMRHRIASYNEESGRYRELRPVFYVPARDRKLIQEGKPGAYVFLDGSAEQHAVVDTATREACRSAYAAYQKMLDAGIAREVARGVLPVATYSSMYVTMNARSLMNFLSLRTKRDGSTFPSYPQREIEMVAEVMEQSWAELMPLTYAAFNANGRVCP